MVFDCLKQKDREITSSKKITGTDEWKTECFAQGKTNSQKMNTKTADSIPRKTQKSSKSPVDKSYNEKNTINSDIRFLSPKKK